MPLSGEQIGVVMSCSLGRQSKSSSLVTGDDIWTAMRGIKPQVITSAKLT